MIGFAVIGALMSGFLFFKWAFSLLGKIKYGGQVKERHFSLVSFSLTALIFFVSVTIWV